MYKTAVDIVGDLESFRELFYLVPGSVKNTVYTFLICTCVNYEIRERGHYRVAYSISLMEMLPVLLFS